MGKSHLTQNIGATNAPASLCLVVHAHENRISQTQRCKSMLAQLGHSTPSSRDKLEIVGRNYRGNGWSLDKSWRLLNSEIWNSYDQLVYKGCVIRGRTKLGSASVSQSLIVQHSIMANWIPSTLEGICGEEAKRKDDDQNCAYLRRLNLLRLLDLLNFLFTSEPSTTYWFDPKPSD